MQLKSAPAGPQRASRRIKVLFDADIFTQQKRGGIRNYFRELIVNLRELGKGVVAVSLAPALVQGETSGLRPLIWCVPKLSERPKWLLKVSQSLFWLYAAARDQVSPVDIYHSTFYHQNLRLRRPVRRVVTVHDMIPEKFPELFPAGNPHMFKQQNVHEADLVLCVSEATRRDLQDVYGTGSEKIRVVPLAAAKLFSPRSRADQFDHYILFVGQRNGYKNFTAFAAMCVRLEHAGIKGIVVGAPWSEVELQKERRNMTLVQATDMELVNLYDRAAAFIYPSRYEGFGIPVLEAMQSGCPCVLASNAAFLEVAGAAALYFDPEDISAAVVSVLQLVEDPNFRSSQIKKGLEQSVRYSWALTAAATLEAYRELVDRD